MLPKISSLMEKKNKFSETIFGKNNETNTLLLNVGPRYAKPRKKR